MVVGFGGWRIRISACLLDGTWGVSCDVMWCPDDGNLPSSAELLKHGTMVRVEDSDYLASRTGCFAAVSLSCHDEFLQSTRLGRAFLLLLKATYSQATCATLGPDAFEHARQPAVQAQGS